MLFHGKIHERVQTLRDMIFGTLTLGQTVRLSEFESNAMYYIVHTGPIGILNVLFKHVCSRQLLSN